MPLLLLLLIAAPPDVAVLRWAGPPGSRPGTFAEWQAATGTRDWQVKLVGHRAGGFEGRVDILVEADLADTLGPALDTMAADIAAEGFDVSLYGVAGTEPESLRAFLQREYQSGLVSAVLVGDLPVAWYQLIDDWNNNGIRDPDEHYEEFPCDLYLMDLDGEWQDTLVRLGRLDSLVPGTDTILDSHSGHVAPEIAVSRLAASRFAAEIRDLTSYLDKARRYRHGELRLADRALVYIDDDWWPNATFWDSDVGLLYPDRWSCWDPETTRALDFRPRIDSAAYESVLLCAHSWPAGHCWYFANRESTDYLHGHEIPGLDPAACFWNLFACSNVRYTEWYYCGGRYVFQTATGLGAIGSSKTGSMLEFDDYYQPLANGRNLGEAFRYWFERQADGGFEPWEKSWFYGMCLVADGTLKPRMTTAVAEPGPGPVRPALNAWPEPFTDRLSVSLAPGTAGPARLRVFDPAGRQLAAFDWPGSSLTLPRSSFGAPGVYLLVLETFSGTAVSRATLAR